MKKGLKIALITIGTIVGLLVLVSLAAGPIVKWYVEKHSVELCHRQATVGRVWINLFSGSVIIKDLQVQEENPKDTFLKFDKLHVRLSLPRMIGKKVQINRVSLDGLCATILQDGIRFNFSDIIDFYVDRPKKESKKDSTPWDVDIRKISVKNSRVVYADANMGSHFDTRNINIDVPRLFLKGGATDAKLEMDLSDKGKIDLGGFYNIETGDFHGDLQLSDFQIEDIQPYVENFLNIGRMTGLANGELKVTGSVQHISDLVASGTLSVKNAKVSNADNTPLGSFSDFKVDIQKVELGKKLFYVNNVSFKDLVLHFDVYKEGTSLSRLIRKNDSEVSATDSVAKVETATSPISYKVGKILVDCAHLIYKDYSISPNPQQFEVKNLCLNATDLKNGTQSPISLSAGLGRSGKLECQGHCDIMDLSTADLDLSIENLDITEFTPYSLYFLAYPIEDGLLSFGSNLTIQNNKLDSHNTLDIYKPKFGNKVKSITPKAAKLPMKAAMYVLTDRKGHVKIDLPVKGDITSPEFSFRKIIWKTFVNLLVKVAASPIDFLANIGSDNPFKNMQFAASPVELSIEESYQLNEIAAVMNEKTETNLSVKISTNPQVSEGTDVSILKQNIKNQCFNVLSNYLVSKGVAASRISVIDGDSPVSSGKTKVEFNLVVFE